jgi:hypothetical protein
MNLRGVKGRQCRRVCGHIYTHAGAFSLLRIMCRADVSAFNINRSGLMLRWGMSRRVF